MHRAYKAHIISTIVDTISNTPADNAYKVHIISTIVDLGAGQEVHLQPIRLI